jgi:hypothetical protein
MAAYQPLRDAFREWNRMLIDGQQFNKQHELNQMDQRMKERQLESNLGLQEFNMKMAAANHELRARGEDLRADKFEWDKNVHNQKVLTENKKWDAERADKKFMNRLTEESHEQAMKNQKTAQQMNELELEQALVQTQEEQLDFSQILPPDVLASPNKMKIINSYANKRGFEIGEDGLAYDADGSGYGMKKYQHRGEVPWLLGAMIQMEDPHVETANRMQNIVDSRDELKAGLKTSGTDNYNLNERAARKREINKLNGELIEEQKFFSPMRQSQFYDRRSAMLRNAARVVAGQGDTKYAALLADEAQEYTDRVKAMNIKGNMVQLYNRDTGEGMGKGSYNAVTGTWKYDGQDYQSLREIPGNPTALDVAGRRAAGRKGAGGNKGMTQNQAMTLVERAHSVMNNKGIPILSTALAPRLQAVRELATNKMNSGVDNLNAPNDALAEVENIENDFWADMDYVKGINKNNKIDMQALVDEIQDMAKALDQNPNITGKTPVKALKKRFHGLRKLMYKKEQNELGIKNPYTPNATMRNLQQGIQ